MRSSLTEAAEARAGWSRVGRLERFAEGRAVVALMAAWGFAEAIAFPIVPDVLLFVLAALVPRRAALLFGAVIGGALVGSFLLHAFAVSTPDGAQALVLSVPGIDRAMLDAAIASVAGGDPAAMAVFGSGTPLKVFTVAWSTGAGGILGLLLGILVNRLGRGGPGLVLAAVVGLPPEWLRRHRRIVLAAYGVAWAVVYWMLWGGGRAFGG
jgi:hypothetical protein